MSINNNKKYIVFDRDGTLIKHKPYMFKPEMVELFDDTIESLKLLKKNGFDFFLHTNQSGVGRGFFKLEDAIKCNNEMIQMIGLGTDLFKKICVAPEFPSTKNGYRKPSTRFGKEIMKDFEINIDNLFYVGDSISDIQTGINLGCHSFGINTGLVNIFKENKLNLHVKIFSSLTDFTNYIINENFK